MRMDFPVQTETGKVVFANCFWKLCQYVCTVNLYTNEDQLDRSSPKCARPRKHMLCIFYARRWCKRGAYIKSCMDRARRNRNMEAVLICKHTTSTRKKWESNLQQDAEGDAAYKEIRFLHYETARNGTVVYILPSKTASLPRLQWVV